MTNVLQEGVDYIEKELTESLTNEASAASHEEIRKRGSARSALVRTCRESSGHKRLGQRVELRIVALGGQPKRFGR